MAELKNTKGIPIRYIEGDPPNPIEGQLWFNASTSQLKGAVGGGASAGTWSSGGALNTAGAFRSAAGTQTQALAMSGDAAPGYLTNVEAYDGSSWTEIADVSNARGNGAGNGAYTSALVYTGSTPSPTYATTGTIQTESWNGSAWSEVSDLNTARRDLGDGIGESNTAALACPGRNSPPITAITDTVEQWNGSSWTEVAELNNLRFSIGGAGSSTSSIIMGGRGSPAGAGGAPEGTALVESWNGSSWTETTEFNTRRTAAGGTGTTNTAALLFGGYQAVSPVGATTRTEDWNGSSWTEVADLAVARYDIDGTGTSSLAITFGGYHPSYRTDTEEWTAPDLITKTVTTS